MHKSIISWLFDIKTLINVLLQTQNLSSSNTESVRVED